MMVLKFNCKQQNQFPDMEYLFLDLSSRRGVMGSYKKSWEEQGVKKFEYRNFNSVNLEEVIP